MYAAAAVRGDFANPNRSEAVLRKHWTALKTITDLDPISDYLYQRGVLSRHKLDEITSENVVYKKCHTLLTYLSSCSEAQVIDFAEFLSKAENGDLSKIGITILEELDAHIQRNDVYSRLFRLGAISRQDACRLQRLDRHRSAAEVLFQTVLPNCSREQFGILERLLDTATSHELGQDSAANFAPAPVAGMPVMRGRTQHLEREEVRQRGLHLTPGGPTERETVLRNWISKRLDELPFSATTVLNETLECYESGGKWNDLGSQCGFDLNSLRHFYQDYKRSNWQSKSPTEKILHDLQAKGMTFGEFFRRLEQTHQGAADKLFQELKNASMRRYTDPSPVSPVRPPPHPSMTRSQTVPTSDYFVGRNPSAYQARDSGPTARGSSAGHWPGDY